MPDNNNYNVDITNNNYTIDIYNLDEYELILNEQGPQGNKGDKGDKGDPGEPGTTDYNELENKPVFSTGLTDNDNTITVTDYNKLVKNTATGTGALNIKGTASSGKSSISIGDQTEATNDGAIAIGNSAKATAKSAIQIGTGTNSTAESLKVGFRDSSNSSIVRNYQLLDGETGLIPDERLSNNIARTSAIPTQASDINAVPDTRTVNGKALSSDIILSASDVGALANTTTINDLTTTEQQNALNSGATSANIGQITTNAGNIEDIESLIPSQATTSNQLADKSFVNSSIATNTANFIGTFNSVSDLEAYSGAVTNNDYAFVVNSVITDNGNDWATFNDLDAYDKSLVTNFDYAWVINGSNFDLYRYDILSQEWDLRVANTQKSSVTLNTAYNRYKATVSSNSIAWNWEYTLNNSSFTASQWAAINSGITSGDVTLINTAIQPSDLATVATSGSYNDLSNKPTIPTVNNNTITIQKNGTTVESFTLNQSSNETINISVPTDTSDLSNNAGYITGINSTDVTTALGYTPVDPSNLSTVATTGSYNDLNNKPTFSTGLTDTSGTITVTDYNKLVKNTATSSDSLTILGTVSSSTNTVNIGYASKGYLNSVAVGSGAEATVKATAIGYGAKVIGSGANPAYNGIQLGYGTNNEEDTFYVGFQNANLSNYKMLDGTTGTIPDARLSSNIARTSDIGNGTITITQGGTTKGTFTTNQSGDATIDLDSGGGSSTDVQINGTSITSGGVANILTNTAYNSSTNKIATMSDVPTNFVTTNTDQNITGIKTFVGEKRIKFKQNTNTNKLGFTLYDNTDAEKGYLEYNPSNKVDNVPLMTLGNYATTSGNITHVGFRKYSSVSGANGAYNLLTPLIADAKSPFNLTTTYTNFYMPLGFTDGTTTVKTAKSGVVDLSSLNIGGGGTATDVQINGTSITSNNVANIVTNTAYNSSSNKIATMSDLPSTANMQTTTNLVTSVSSSSTDSQYPSAKLFYDTVGDIETLLSQV